nr:hypothetical protein [uncultured Pseudogulbenkiania sp.]
MSVSALNVNVSIAQPFVVAGVPFTLTTTFENNHEGPIEVLFLSYHVPYDVQWIQEQKYTDRFEWLKSNKLKSILFSNTSWKAGISAPGQAMYYGHADSHYETSVFDLLPGESGTYSFSSYVRRWLFASGGELVFPGQVKYRYKDEIHYHTFEVRFTLRPPLLANGIGSIVGSIAGPIAKGLRDQGPTFFSSIGITFIAGVTLTAILSLVAVIYSSRKTGEAQPIITVEDFWGGFLVGFLIGFTGNELFGKIVPIPNS